ncbi:MAG: 50S ribosomal protein L22 [Patescibacteria group bacterium]
MAKVTAKLSNYRQSTRKVRIVANLVRGKKATAAVTELNFLAKRAGDPLAKLIESALANAKNLNIDKENLIVKEIRVDQGVTLHRSMPRARGRAFPIKKRSAHVMLTLEEAAPKASKKKSK